MAGSSYNHIQGAPRSSQQWHKTVPLKTQVCRPLEPEKLVVTGDGLSKLIAMDHVAMLTVSAGHLRNGINALDGFGITAKAKQEHTP